MIRDITLGQYYQTDSVLHRLDCRVKLVGTLAFIISLFVVNNVWGYLLAAMFLALCIRLSNVPFKFMVKGMKSIVFLMLFAVVFNLFLTPGTPAVTIWKLKITWEGIEMASKMAIRLVMLIIGSSLMTLTTTPNHLTDGLESLLNPLKKLKVPVHEVSMMMSIALRFIPILLEETDKIMKAQIARGADFENGSLIQRAKAMVPLLVPLFIAAFRRANDLAMAMEARCYRGGEGRTKMKPLDIGLIGAEDDMSAFVFEPLTDIQDIFVTTHTYLDNLKERIRPNDHLSSRTAFAASTLLLLNKENITRRYIDRYLSQENLSASRIIDVTSMDLLIEFAKIDLGIACVIKNFVRDELAEGRLVQLKMPVSIPARKIGFAYAKSGAIPPTVRKLLSFLQELEVQKAIQDRSDR